MSFIALFPVGLSQIEIGEPSDSQKYFIGSIETKLNNGNRSSVNTHVLDEDIFDDLRNKIKVHVDDYFKQIYMPKGNVSLKITQSWLNYSNSGEFHHKHSHVNSVISGVYYPQADHPEDRIEFFDPKPEQQLQVYSDGVNDFNAKSIWVPARTGFLYLFPSFLKHGVPAIEGRSSTRISLSFNTFYEGEIGGIEELAHLKLSQ